MRDLYARFAGFSTHDILTLPEQEISDGIFCWQMWHGVERRQEFEFMAAALGAKLR